MNTLPDECVQSLIAFASISLEGKSQRSISNLCKFRCGLFDGKKKYHLFRETAFLNLFVIHAVCRTMNVPSEKINATFNYIYRLKFQGKENMNTWFSDLLKRINAYVETGTEKETEGGFAIAGLFLLNLKSFDKMLPGFEQISVAEYVSKLFAVLTQTMEKYR